MISPASRRLLLVSGKRRHPGKLRLIESSGPREALARLAREPFEAVAVELPRKTAADFASRVREDHPGVIVIVIVPDRNEAFKKAAIAAGAHAVVAAAPDSPARISLLETALLTVQLALMNQRLATTAWTTARSLAQAVKASRESRRERSQARDSGPRPPAPLTPDSL